jgi:hypothetical protein
MGGVVFRMSFGEPTVDNRLDCKLNFTAYLPQIVFLLFLVAIGITIPKPILSFIQSAAGFLY